MFSCSIFFCLEASTYQISIKIPSNGLNFAKFLHFWSILAVFWLKNGQKGRNPKKFFVAFFCWEASTYQISENFIKHFRFCQFSSFLFNFGCFLVKKRPKKAKIQTKFFVAFCFVEKHLHTNFQKILSNGLDFGNFSFFFFCCF